MYIFHIAAFLILILYISWKCEIRLVEAVPVGSAILILMLYVLSFFRMLMLSDYIMIAGVAVTAFFFVKMSKEQRGEILNFVRQELFSASTLTALGLTVVVVLCVNERIVSWWDDYNFWATDVKSIFYLDGFADKYANVATEFGDYPPGTQMIKWWFLHFSPIEFRENLIFAGYYFMNLAFLFPLLKNLKRRNIFIMVASALALWLFPAVVEVMWYEGCCADLTMAIVYGAFLASVTDRECGNAFYYGRQALFLSVLVLCKNTGFVWMIFGLIFSFGYHSLVYKRGERRKKALLIVMALPLLTEISWLGFCFLNKRVAVLTDQAIQMAAGSMGIPDYQEEMVKVFIQAFIRYPLHRWNTIAVDLSPLGMYLLLILFVFLLYQFHVVDKYLAVFMEIFFILSGILFYSFNLISHLTIFARETQYLDPATMILSIERYGAPFFIGGMYLTAYFALNSRKQMAGAVLCIIFVFLTTDYASAYYAVNGYKKEINSKLAIRKERVDESAEEFLRAIGAGQRGSIGRVLYLCDIADVNKGNYTFINFEAAPVSVMYKGIDRETMNSEDIAGAVRKAHAGFLYINPLSDSGEELFRPFIKDEKLEYNCLYRVCEEDGVMHWEKYIGG